MHIVGGTYHEVCYEPFWNHFFGSGVRAALSLAAVLSDIELFTYIGTNDIQDLNLITSPHGIILNETAIDKTICFQYTHGLSTPTIYPHPIQIEKHKPLTVKSDVVLRFGMIEGDAIVEGDTVIYDPQSCYAPKDFHANGSKAKRLAIVTNEAEAHMMTRESDLTQMTNVMLAWDNVEAVVIKRGTKGSYIATASSDDIMPVYETNFVWPIGTGDIYSAQFAYQWAYQGKSAPEAADMASKAVAVYCNTLQVPIPFDYLDNFNFPTGNPEIDLSSKQVYLAGPFFSMAQRWLIKESLIQLQNLGLKVFSPYHHVGIGSASEIYHPDIEGLEKSQIVFACLDGLDSGTLFEIGYAVKQGIPVVVFVQSESKGDLKMIEGGPCIVCNDFCTAIYKTAWLADKL